jgi:hypothetical protein
MISRWVVKRLHVIEPERRRLHAARVLVVSILGWVVSHILFLVLGITGLFEHTLNLISWWAITLTAWDVLATTDVKVDTA